MNKLNLDEQAALFLEDICSTNPASKVDAELCLKVLDNLKKTYPTDSARLACARACKALLIKYNEKSNDFFDKLINSYQTAYQKSEPKLDDLGRKKINPLKDSYSDHRLSIAVILVECIPVATTKSINKLIAFFVPGAISDRNTQVQETMLEAAIVMINEHGTKRAQQIMTNFQTFLAKSSKTGDNENTRRNVIILLGNMAKHLDPKDPQVKTILAQLIQALNTPSQVVQEAVANCFPPLIETYRNDSTGMLKELNKALYDGTDNALRRGAAYGIAGIAKGLGMQAIKQQTNFMRKAIQDAKVNKKIGALIGIQVFIRMLGRLFEPYILQLLPSLLVCFGDSTTTVRDTAEITSKEMMSHLSATGVRLTLPYLLKAIDEDAWRTKVGSVQLLASMGNCAPKQLSLCLPIVVPKVMEVLGDSHMKVQEAATQALRQLGNAIRNPEIAQISKQIMSALQDPVAHTHSCLVSITQLEFRHYVDPASLSLIMPVLQRGFKERSSETRKIAAQIIGSLYALTNPGDLSPYLTSVVPGIKTSVLDPAPEVRSVTARALGAMVRGSGEDMIVELMPWLQEKLTCDTSQVDRSGAAQSIAEVIGALGQTRLASYMEQIISNVHDPKLGPHIKDGYLMLIIYIPNVMRDDFSPFVGRIITPILNGLAEDVEYVRETAIQAGQQVVSMYCDSAVRLMLPELEKGLYVDNWRVRFSSVKLVGDLLYKVSGITGRGFADRAEEDESGDGKSEESIKQALGNETRNRILAGVYICRSDVSAEVKHTAMQIWKMVISNTPKTLREILPTMFNILLTCLADDDEDRQQMATRTLGEVVKKLGERVLPDVVPILEDGLKSKKTDYRVGVCKGLGEIISSASKEMEITTSHQFIGILRKALQDPMPEVRQAAAASFDYMYQTMGPKALDDVLPPLIKQLNDPATGDAVLDGIKQMVAIRTRGVLAYTLPYLTDHTPVNTKALAALASVAGESLIRHMAKIMPAMLTTLARKLDTKEEKRDAANCSLVLLSASDFNGTQTIVEHLVQASRSEELVTRRAASILLNGFCRKAKLFSSHVSQLLRVLLYFYTEENPYILDQSREALNHLIGNMSLHVCIEFMPDVRNAVRSAVSEIKMSGKFNKSKSSSEIILPGFKAGHGFIPLLRVYRETILNGTADRKELAASSLCEIIKHSSESAVQANAGKIAGFVIRILSESMIKDRHPKSVRAALLDVLLLLLTKSGAKLRPFVPQCGWTLRKLQSDYYTDIRAKTNEALNKLNHLTTSDTGIAVVAN